MANAEGEDRAGLLGRPLLDAAEGGPAYPYRLSSEVIRRSVLPRDPAQHRWLKICGTNCAGSFIERLSTRSLEASQK